MGTCTCNCTCTLRFAPQLVWLLLLAAPRAPLARSLCGPIWPVLALSLAHLAIVLLAASAPGGTEPILIFADVRTAVEEYVVGLLGALACDSRHPTAGGMICAQPMHASCSALSSGVRALAEPFV